MPGTLLACGFDNSEMTGRFYTATATALQPVRGVPALGNPDTAYGLRDPALAYYAGWYWLVATKPRRSAYLGAGAINMQLYRSANLVDWVLLPDVPAGVPGATRAWAPELLVDGDEVYLYVAVTTDTAEDASAIASFDIYARRAASPDLTSWGPVVRMTGLTGPSRPKVIDPCVVRTGDPRGPYVMIIKDETAATLCRAWAASPLGPWTVDRAGAAWLGTTGQVEGPELVRWPDGSWRLFYDAYGANRLAYRDSPDLDTWGPETALTYAPAGLRHPGYLWLTAEQYVALLTRRRAVRAYTTATPAFSVPPNKPPTPIPMGTAQGDTELWNPTNPTRFTAPVPGWGSLHYTLRWDNSPVGQRSAPFKFSDGVVQYRDSRTATGGGMGTEHGGSDEHVWLDAGEYVEVCGVQTSGAALGVNAVVSFALEPA